MNAFVPLPAQFRWTPQQIANAVPLRLSEAIRFDAARDADAGAAANSPRRRARAGDYLPVAAPAPRFRIS